MEEEDFGRGEGECGGVRKFDGSGRGVGQQPRQKPRQKPEEFELKEVKFGLKPQIKW